MSMTMTTGSLEDTTLADVNSCLEHRHWFYFLSSSLLTFLIGFVLILIIRLVQYALRYRRERKEHRQSDAEEEEEANYYTKVRWRCLAIVSGQTLAGKILLFIYCALSFASFVIYCTEASVLEPQVEICVPWVENTRQQVDFAFNLFFLLHFILRFVAAQDKLLFWISLESIVDYFTVPPAFVGLCLNRQWLGLRFLRALCWMTVPDILQYLKVLRTSSQIRLAQLVGIFLGVWLSAAGMVCLLENTGDPMEDYSNVHVLPYWECVYFLMVTMSTVGYGDIYCGTTLGRIFDVIFILGALAMFASFIPAIAEIVSNREQYGEAFEKPVGFKHVIICGAISYDSVYNFIKDFFHADREAANQVKLLVLDNKNPSLELKALIKRNFTKVAFLKGSVMNVVDLKRIQIQNADACIIMANRYNKNPDAEDAGNIMRIVAIKDFEPNARVIVQLMRYHNKAFCVNLPAWTSRDQVVCLQQMKLGCMAAGCLAPGFLTMLSNLITMRSYQENVRKKTRRMHTSTSDTCVTVPLLQSARTSWRDLYKRGAGMEVYTEKFSPAFYGCTFQTAVELCYTKLGVLLVAVARRQDGGTSGSVLLNPGRETIIDQSMIGFIICQEEDESKRISHYCASCHDNVSDVKLIKACLCAVKAKEETNQNELTAVQLTFNNREFNAKGSLTKALQDQSDDSEKDLAVRSEDESTPTVPEQFDITGLFYWCPKRTFDDVLLSNPKNKQIVKNLRNHIILCCFATANERMMGLFNFILSLRASSIPSHELQTVVLIGNRQFLASEWTHISNLPLIFVSEGSPLNRADLRAVKINRCHICAVLPGTVSEEEDAALVDKQALLCTLNIKTMKFPMTDALTDDPVGRTEEIQSMLTSVLSRNRILLLTELVQDSNAQFIDQDDDDDEEDMPFFLTQPFACGRTFTESLLYSVISSTYYNMETFNLVLTLVMGGNMERLEEILAEGAGFLPGNQPVSEVLQTRRRSRLKLIAIPDKFVNCSYGQMFFGVIISKRNSMSWSLSTD